MAIVPGDTAFARAIVRNEEGTLATVTGNSYFKFYSPDMADMGSISATLGNIGTYKGFFNVPTSGTPGKWKYEFIGTSGSYHHRAIGDFIVENRN